VQTDAALDRREVRLPADSRTDGSVAALYPIRVVARLTGINPVTIRAWERRYALVSPERTPGGHRLYSRADVELLRAASRLVEQGVSISRAACVLDEPAAHRAGPGDTLVEKFMACLRALDEDGMNAVLETSLARESTAASPALVDRLPGLAPALPPLEQRFLDSWLEGQLAFRNYQRMASAAERRVLVCSPSGPGLRTWALAFSLGLVGSGLRPVPLASSEPGELEEAARRIGAVAVVFGGGARHWPGLASAALPMPVFLADGGNGFLPLGDRLEEARRRVMDFPGLRGGRT
jgi:MerR family transcriptional regulator, light-induced transcriptional regulator